MKFCEFEVKCDGCQRSYTCKVPIGVPDSLGNIFTEESLAHIEKFHSIQVCPMCDIEGELPQNAVVSLSIKGRAKEVSS